ncbi:MAG TPA: ATP-binding protein [Blastocatellia bacterium]|nr:ATP-binding protein [Blastocatellia bacterium]
MVPLSKKLAGYAVSMTGVTFVTALYTLGISHVNTTTVSLSLLLVVLAVASTYGLGPGILASVLGMLCFNFFFLEPVGTFTIRDPQNWVALSVFLVTAATASHLSSRARVRAREAERRREEVTKLYQLSRAIIATPESDTAAASIARQVIDVFGAAYCAVFLPADGEWVRAAYAADLEFEPVMADVRDSYEKGSRIVYGHNWASEQPPASVVIYTPLKVGVRSTGVLAMITRNVDPNTVDAIAGLVALALERARFLKEVSRTEALRQSDELKAAILASISHDLRTPLTAIRAAVESLLETDVELDREALNEFHSIIAEEVERLTGLIQNLLEMARIEAGELRVARQWESVEELIDSVLLRCEPALRSHRIEANSLDVLPLVKIDARLISQALANLIDNAAKYSPATSEIALNVRIEHGTLIVSIADEGEGIAPDELELVFEKFYRGKRSDTGRREGTGLGLAIARGIVGAHGGKIWAENGAGRGARFVFSIPVEYADAEETVSLVEKG